MSDTCCVCVVKWLAGVCSFFNLLATSGLTHSASSSKGHPVAPFIPASFRHRLAVMARRDVINLISADDDDESTEDLRPIVPQVFEFEEEDEVEEEVSLPPVVHKPKPRHPFLPSPSPSSSPPRSPRREYDGNGDEVGIPPQHQPDDSDPFPAHAEDDEYEYEAPEAHQPEDVDVMDLDPVPPAARVPSIQPRPRTRQERDEEARRFVGRESAHLPEILCLAFGRHRYRDAARLRVLQRELADMYNVAGAGRDATGDSYPGGGRIYVEHRTVDAFENIRQLLPHVRDQTVAVLLDYAFMFPGYSYQPRGQEARWIDWARLLFLERPAMQFVIIPSPISPDARGARQQPLGRVSPLADAWLATGQPYDLVVLPFDTGAPWNPLWRAAEIALAADSREKSMRQLADYQLAREPMALFFLFRPATGLTELRRVMRLLHDGVEMPAFPVAEDMLPARREQLAEVDRREGERRRRRDESSEGEEDDDEPAPKRPRFRCYFCGRAGVKTVYVNDADEKDVRYSCNRTGCKL